MAECYYKEGRSLLERCDKLLHSIAEITGGNEQPSPVSVLDAGTFYREEEEEDGSPPPIPMKRCLLFHGTLIISFSGFFFDLFLFLLFMVFP